MTNNILQNLLDAHKEVFDYISDQTVDLNKRWDFFLKMPESLRKTRLFRLDIKSVSNEIMNELIYQEKGQVIYAETLLSNIDTLVEYAKTDTLSDYSRGAVKFKKKLLEINIEKLQEEILSHGCYAFVNNW